MEIVEYNSKYKDDFIRLNTEWLTKLYYIESYDQYSMDHVEELIEKGSMVYFAVENEKVLATCMIEPLGGDIWEICKLAAEGQYTGTGAGSAVLKACMDYAISHGAKKICLITISGLKPAIHLYKKFGFVEIPYRKDVWKSEKADVEMEYIVSDKRKNELLNNIDSLHTTELGVVRIKKNLSLDTDDVVRWCRDKINSDNAVITRNGKNWYISIDGCIITVNAYSYTIITAHKEKR